MGHPRTLLTALVLSVVALLTGCELTLDESPPTVGGIFVPHDDYDAAPERGSLELHRRAGGTVGEATAYDKNESQLSYVPLPRDPDPDLFEDDIFHCDASAPSGARGLVVDHLVVRDASGTRVGVVESSDRHDDPDAYYQHHWVYLPQPVQLDTTCPHPTLADASIRIDVDLPAGWHVLRTDTNDTTSGDPQHAVEHHGLEPGTQPDIDALTYHGD